MKLATIAFVLCAAVCLAAGDGGLLRGKARLISKLARHHKRGVFHGIPSYKVGYDIPHVTHSIAKPVIVQYPPSATVTTVKVPLGRPFVSPHHLPSPHHHFHPNTKTVVVGKPSDSHFHHHHHHAVPVPQPVPVPAPVPVVPATTASTIVPIPQPTVVHPLPAPPPPPVFFRPAPVRPLPVIPPAPVFRPFPPQFAPLLPAASVPIQPTPVLPAPAVPIPHPVQYVLRPGNAVQTSVFATFPRYPLQYQPPFYPIRGAVAPVAPVYPAPVAPAPGPVFLERPYIHAFQGQGAALVPQAHAVPVQPTQTVVQDHVATQPGFHVHPTQPVAVEHDGWAPVPPHPHDVPLPDPHQHQLQPDFHADFSQDQGHQVFEHHTGQEQQYHDLQNQLHHHVQNQIDQAQFDQHLHEQHHLNQDYGAPQQVNHGYGQPNEYHQDFNQVQHPQDFHQVQHPQDFNPQDFAQSSQDFAQNGHDFTQQGDFSQHQHQDFHYQQPGNEYGAPGVEGRSSNEEEQGDELKYHNHIPLGLQPPLDRPLEHFR